MSEPTSVILDKAADAIELFGWARGSGWWYGQHMSGMHRRLCAEGALQYAMKTVHYECGPRRYEFTQTPAYQAMVAITGEPHLHSWNDNYASGACVVIETFREAARRARMDEEIEKAMNTKLWPFNVFKAKVIRHRGPQVTNVGSEDKELVSV